MIITKIQGGLGNQMFQYAIGRHLAYLNKTELKLDISFYKDPKKNTFRKYALGNFNIIENFISDDEAKKIKINNFHNKSLPTRILRRILKSLEERKPIYKRSYIREPYFHFCEEILKIKDKKYVYLYGHWQSEKYFKGIENIIRREFTLKNSLSQPAESILKQIKNTNSVSLHIRRGDYAKNEKTNRFHGICSLKYYHQALKIITSKISKPRLFIFSDDILWAKKNLKTKNPITFVSGIGIGDAEEIILMSQCRHNIIANSTFSWWGAWLNNNPHKIVIAPRQWFNIPSINTKDVYPKNWIKINR